MREDRLVWLIAVMNDGTKAAGMGNMAAWLATRACEFREFVARELDTAAGPKAVGAVGLGIERKAQEVANELGRLLMAEALRAADTHSPEITVSGVTWGCRTVRNGTYETAFGEVSLARSTYQRAGRGRVAIPVDLRLGIVERRYTPLVARIANRSLASMPPGEGEALLKEIGVCLLSRSTLHRLPQAMLARVDNDLDTIERNMRALDAIPAEAVTVQVALDGVMVPMDGEGAGPRGRKAAVAAPARHETKYGDKSLPDPRSTSAAEAEALDDDQTSAPANDTRGLAWREASVGTVSFWDAEGEHLKTTYLGEMPFRLKEKLVDRLQREFADVHAERPDLRVVFASDGAETQWRSLEQIANAVLGDGPRVMLLDFFHCAMRVGTAAKAVWGTTEDATVQGEHWKTVLREKTRGAGLVLKSLEYQRSLADPIAAATLTKAMNYIARNKNAGRLHYAAAKSEKLPIGTGVVEAAAKTLVTVRMKRSGARYTDHGGQTILTLRAAVLSDRFDTLSAEIEASYCRKIAA